MNSKLNTIKLNTVVRAVACLLTLAAIVGFHFLPKKTLDLVPSSGTVIYPFADSTYGGKSEVEWFEGEFPHWRCHLRQSDVWPSCGISLTWSEPPHEARDLSAYTKMIVVLEYKGDMSRIRIYMRNQDPAYADPMRIETSKFMSVTLRISDFQPDAELFLAEFAVAEWWLDEYTIPREHAHPDMRNIASIGIDNPAPVVFGEHEFRLHSLTLEGDWITLETLYASIIVGWMLILGWEGLRRFVYLHKRALRDSRRVQELAEESDKFRELSMHDALTGIHNRTALEARLDNIHRQGQVLTGRGLLMLDLDHFKRINDNRGHELGDRVLKEFANLTNGLIRSEDTLVRWGGEEFLILCGNMSLQGLTAFGDKLCDAVSNMRLEVEPPLRVTVSGGGVIFGKDETFQDAFKRADEALYMAKNLGRNRVVVQ